MPNDSERLAWLADTVLCCDYGDNQRRLPGWRVREFIAPIMYGHSIADAIDSAMEADRQHRIMRSKRSAQT